MQITTETIDGGSIVNALQLGGEVLIATRRMFNNNLVHNNLETLAAGISAARLIIDDLDNFLDKHPQV